MAVSKIQTGLRIDEETYGKLKTISSIDNRSLNNLIEYIQKILIRLRKKQWYYSGCSLSRKLRPMSTRTRIS